MKYELVKITEIVAEVTTDIFGLVDPYIDKVKEVIASSDYFSINDKETNAKPYIDACIWVSKLLDDHPTYIDVRDVDLTAVGDTRVYYEAHIVDDDDDDDAEVAPKLWYALQRDSTDEWDVGSYDRDEAIRRMLNSNGRYTLIAVINQETGCCIDEIRAADEEA